MKNNNITFIKIKPIKNLKRLSIKRKSPQNKKVKNLKIFYMKNRYYSIKSMLKYNQNKMGKKVR